MAYDAAIEASVDPALIDIYLSSVILSDPAWYSESDDPAVHLSRSEQLEMQLDACTKGVVELEEWLDKLEVEPYVLAPIISEERWDAHEQTLETFGQPQDLPRTKPHDGAHVKGLGTDVATGESNTHPLRSFRPGPMAPKL